MAVAFRAVASLLLAFVCTEALKLEGGQLRADQESEVHWDEDSKKWVIRLTCGSFSFLGSPPLNVTWTTPEGESRFSSGYKNGRFFLNLDSPMKGGNYSCAIPVHHLPLVCEDGEGVPDQSNGSAVVEVDDIKARLRVAEADQLSLEKQVEELQRRHHSDLEQLKDMCANVSQRAGDNAMEIERLQQTLDNSQAVDLSGPCADGEYNFINTSWRSVDNKLEHYEDYYCDRDILESGRWYRFSLDGVDAVIPTYCVEDNHCQTHATQWVDLQGKSLPDVGEEVHARACANWDDDCCNWESPIVVRNCGPYFVYKVQPRDTCHLAFCNEPKN